ncbi:MAG: tRNA (adenosine(37)-N6)-threonylcarbamoyltransferase complex dimerization subunit type 1 TsaB [Nocardioidaceae bacterium]|nr:tRNA (adenosine(37)-N6)-threonylcarbamoyltransferase complex dimerization subunit type 1 TsaB [Nocardioidaceae bacterium]
MLLLAFDTATPAVTAALHDGERVVAAATSVDARRHGELLAPAIATVLRDAGADRRDVTAIAVGVGPGPFTGLRVGLVTARTLAAALGVPVHGVCTLDAIAAAVSEPVELAVATDARRKEVYWARYRRHDASYHRVQGPAVSRPEDLARELTAALPVLGRGALLYADVLTHQPGPLDPDAAVLAEAVVRGEIELLAAEPLYLRRPDVSVPGPRKPAL